MRNIMYERILLYSYSQLNENKIVRLRVCIYMLIKSIK